MTDKNSDLDFEENPDEFLHLPDDEIFLDEDPPAEQGKALDEEPEPGVQDEAPDPQAAARAGEFEEKYNAEHDKYLRLYADFENFRKRTAKERSQIYAYAVQPLLEKLLKVLDSFNIALASLDDESASITQGFALIDKQLKDALMAEGLSVVPTVGEMFNPLWHHSVATGSDDTKPDGMVLEEFIAGYKLKDRVIRAAMVKVNKLENSHKQEDKQ